MEVVDGRIQAVRIVRNPTSSAISELSHDVRRRRLRGTANKSYFVSFTVRVTWRVLPAASTSLTVIVAVTSAPLLVA